MPFLADGIRAGQKCICVLESLAPADVLVRLDRLAGRLGGDRAARGDHARRAYLLSGTFSGDDMLSYSAGSGRGLRRPGRACSGR